MEISNELIHIIILNELQFSENPNGLKVDTNNQRDNINIST